ncbi:MAG: DUF1700 domain-containing protein [Lactovum sp.]
MTKEEFFRDLKKKLSHLPKQEVEKALSYYEESFEDKLEDGFTLEEVIVSFSNTEEIVTGVEEEVSLTSIVKDGIMSKTKENKINKLMLFVGSPLWLILFACLLALLVTGLTIFWTIPIVLVSIYTPFILTGVLSLFIGLVRMLTINIMTGLAYFSLGLIMIGLVIMFFQPLLFILKKFFDWNVWPLKKAKEKLIELRKEHYER